MSAGEGRLGGPEVEPGERVERLAQGRPVRGHERRQLVEDPRDLLGLGDLRLAPGVAELDHDERLDEQRLAAARRVVDDALDPRAGLGLDRHDVAAVAERDDRLLERAAELRADERVQASPQPVVGDADRRAQAAETRRGRVEQLPDRIEAARERAAQRRAAGGAPGRGRAGAAGARRRARSPGGRSRRGSRRARGTAPARGGRRGPRARWPVRCRGRPRSRRPDAPSRSARAWSVSSSAARRRRPGRPTARAPRPGGGTAGTRSPRPGAPGRAGTRAGRSSGRPSAARAASARRARTGDRRVPGERESPRAARPRLAGVGDADPRRGHDGRDRDDPVGPARGGAATRGRTGRCRSSDRSSPNAAPTRPGPLASRWSGSRREPAVAGRRPAEARRRDAAMPRAIGAHRLDALERLDGADEHRGGASRRVRSPRSGSRTSRRQGTRRRCPAVRT